MNGCRRIFPSKDLMGRMKNVKSYSSYPSYGQTRLPSTIMKRIMVIYRSQPPNSCPRTIRTVPRHCSHVYTPEVATRAGSRNQAVVLSRSHIGVSPAGCVLWQSEFRGRHLSNTGSVVPLDLGVGETIITASGGGRNGTEAGLDECIIYRRQVVRWLA